VLELALFYNHQLGFMLTLRFKYRSQAGTKPDEGSAENDTFLQILSIFSVNPHYLTLDIGHLKVSRF
jgi:hypothetical protein